ncbi:NADPH-dependent F420 reductase [Microbacterium sp. P05]|uniref:NADPH-dependent F420 reductase n=1 Tax=Microbacterium sp. P05 TaxID=3366948 RepID=UPI003745A2CF
MTIGLIGVGHIGTALAADLVDGGATVALASHTLGSAETVVETLSAQASAETIDELLLGSDVILLAVPYGSIHELITRHADALVGKIVVDPSNAVAPDADGNLHPILPTGQTAGGNIAGWLPAGARYVKAFGTLGADSLRDGAHQSPPTALFYATDTDEAVPRVEEVIRLAGFAPVLIGGVDQVKRIEMGPAGDLHQYGGLQGRLLTEAQARALL